MNRQYMMISGSIAIAISGMLSTGAAFAERMHGISMYGEPALQQDFVSLPYVNPDAPKGGRIVTGQVGSFDSLNPHIRRGTVPWQLRFLVYESLMGRTVLPLRAFGRIS